MVMAEVTQPAAPPAPVAAAPEAPQVAATEQADRKELPATASPLPALTLAGLLAVAAGLTLRRVAA